MISFAAWLGLLLVGLNLVHDPTVHDKTLVPRLHALVIVVLAALPTLVLPRVAGRIDLGVLREPVILCAVGYAAGTAASLLVAVNPTAGLIDLVRTGAFTLVLVVACLLLPLVPRWPDHLLRWLVVAAVGGGLFQRCIASGVRVSTCRTSGSATPSLAAGSPRRRNAVSL